MFFLAFLLGQFAKKRGVTFTFALSFCQDSKIMPKTRGVNLTFAWFVSQNEKKMFKKTKTTCIIFALKIKFLLLLFFCYLVPFPVFDQKNAVI